MQKKNRELNHIELPLVSVIIPCKNSGKFIADCLNSINEQIYQNIEIIIVDNNSRDNTKEIASKYTDLVFDKQPERSAQRNFGFNKSTGKFVIFIDSDMLLTKDVIAQCVRKSLEGNADGMYIPEVSIGKGFWAKCKAFEKECYIGDNLIEAARFFKRETFFEVGGFDEKLIAAEDWDLSLRILNSDYKLDRIEAFIIHNEGKLHFLDIIKKKYYYGKNIHLYIQKHPAFAKKQLKIFRAPLIRNWKKISKNPLIFISVIILKIVEFSAGGAGYLKQILSIKKKKDIILS